MMAGSLAACATQGTSVGVARVEVSSEDLVFESVQVRSTNHRQLRLVNEGTADTMAYLSAEPPFSANTTSIRVPALSSAPMSVQFTPLGFEEHSGTLTLRIDGVERRIVLFGTVNPDWDNDGHNDAYLGFGDDCDDTKLSINPSQAEVCDGLDNDCDGVVDNDPVDIQTWFLDVDGDDYGTTTSAVQSCVAPADHVLLDGDCDDSRSDVYPGASESSDHVDNDCDGFIDEHHLDERTLFVSEIMIEPMGVSPQYIELRSTHPLWVHLDGLKMLVGSDAVALPSVQLQPGDAVTLLCGQESPGSVEGVLCAGTLPNLALDGSVEIVSTEMIEQVDWTGWRMTESASLEVHPSVSRAIDNDLESAWCVATSQMNELERGSPGTISGHCDP